jgi:hypothetical protein
MQASCLRWPELTRPSQRLPHQTVKGEGSAIRELESPGSGPTSSLWEISEGP